MTRGGWRGRRETIDQEQAPHSMTGVQIYFGIGLPVIAVLASLTVSLVRISALREEMRANMQAIREDIREIRADIREIRGNINLLTGRA
jgi:hypothetical protein